MLTHWLLGDVAVISKCHFQIDYTQQQIGHPLWNCSHMNIKPIRIQHWFDCCLTAPSHHFGQSWPRSTSAYGVISEQCVEYLYFDCDILHKSSYEVGYHATVKCSVTCLLEKWWIFNYQTLDAYIQIYKNESIFVQNKSTAEKLCVNIKIYDPSM